MESMDGITSPLFPQLALSSETALKLPAKPLAHSGSVLLYLILAEKNLYIQGFEENEFKERPPLLLRGSLFLKVTKLVKIKLINLKFSGIAKTDWPEGIPPKKVEYLETQQLIQHNWPFFNSNINLNDPNKGANIFRPMDSPSDEISSFSLEPNLSTKDSSGSLANVLRRATSPSPIRSSRSRSNTTNNNAASSLFSHLTGTTSNVLESVTSNDLQSIRSVETINDPNSNKVFLPGDYIFNFELPIPASTPESISVTFGSVNYVLEASVDRSGAFKTSISGKETINIIRTPSDLSLEENEPIAIVRDWEERLRYEIVIASKAVVLNTYLPLAFKLTPLEKIQLHRIRVYLTENLEYYCRHKKIHRLEPTRKYLLLEHKPESGTSSLLGDDEINARELEFQVYVPEKLNDKQKLHPDTSYSNIQSHHWIKICLRLSKPTPTDENPAKRKHYEITIDSPIHILSPMATHANTLLPSYDQAAPLGIDYTTNPPLSPNVVLVDNSLDAMISTSPMGVHSDEQLYHPPNMNLGSNLYKPLNVLPELMSPQAQPFSPIISPEMAALSPNLHAMGSPGLTGLKSPQMIARPIHLLRRPSVNPPPFNADSAPPPCDDEPPAYQETEESQRKSEADIGETFAFLGLSPDLPNSILRATSPVSRSRSATRMRRAVTESPQRTSNSPVSPSVLLPRLRMPRTAESFLNDLDDGDVTASFPALVPHAASPPLQPLLPLGLVLVLRSPILASPTQSEFVQSQATLSPTSSIASSTHSATSSEQFDTIGVPLLNSNTSTSTMDPYAVFPRDRFQSTLSMDITSMYANSNNTDTSLINSLNQQRSESIWHPLDSDFTHINNPHLYKRPVFNSKFTNGNNNNSVTADDPHAPLHPPTDRQMSFGVEQIISALPPSVTKPTHSSLNPVRSGPGPLPSSSRTLIADPSSIPSSDGNSLNSNNSNSTLKSNITTADEENVRLSQTMGSPETRKLSSTSSTRQTLTNQDIAY